MADRHEEVNSPWTFHALSKNYVRYNSWKVSKSVRYIGVFYESFTVIRPVPQQSVRFYKVSTILHVLCRQVWVFYKPR